MSALLARRWGWTPPSGWGPSPAGATGGGAAATAAIHHSADSEINTQGNASDIIGAIYQDTTGTYWFATYGGGLVAWDEATGAFIGASWAALLVGGVAFIAGLWNAGMPLNEKGYYFTLFLYGLFSAVSLPPAKATS